MQNNIFPGTGRKIEADDMLDWSRRLKALGRAINNLAYHQCDLLVQEEGQELGDIISDYADRLHSATEAALGAIMDAFRSDDGSLTWALKKELARLQKFPPHPGTVVGVNESLEKIEAFLSEVKEISELKTEFLKLRERAFTGGKVHVAAPAGGQH